MHKSVKHATLIPGVDVISIKSDRTFPRHTHDEFGVGYMVEGGQNSWSGRGLVEAQAGDVITVNPGEMHDGLGRKDSPRHWRMLYLTPKAIESFADLPAKQIELRDPVLRNRERQTLVAQAIATLANNNPDPSLIEEQLILALRSMIEPVSKTQEKTHCSSAVRLVIEKMEAEYAQPLSLSDYAATAQMSRYQILRHFAAEIGATPHAFLLQHRVKQARRLIRSGFSLADASTAAGFVDQSHMTRSFVRQFGITPGRLLKSHAA